MTTNALKLYDKIDDPMQAVGELAKWFHQSKIMGVGSPGDGAVLAMTCMAEGMTPLDFVRKYHIVNGRPSMRADAMHAAFRSAGGRVRWIKTGDDKTEARAEFAIDGQKLELAYTIDDGKASSDNFGKDGSNWSRDAGAMLRARLITKAVRMLAPELVTGMYDPSEIDDTQPVATIDATVESVSSTAAPVAESEPAEPVNDSVDVPFETVVDEPAAPAKCSNDQLQVLAALGSKITNAETGKPWTMDEIATGICQFASVDDPADMTAKQADELIGRFKAMVAKMQS